MKKKIDIMTKQLILSSAFLSNKLNKTKKKIICSRKLDNGYYLKKIELKNKVQRHLSHMF